jgi:hypothetical protein
MIYKIQLSNGDKTDLINYIKTKKSEGKFTVVDVGGSVNGWSSPYIDAVVDFNDLEKNNTNIKHFKCDITHPDSYKDIFSYVEENGKFDFCICSHTLEDIMNPVYVSEQICKISNEGYISFPSKFRELSRFEGGNYRGYIHHRWIFKFKKENKIIAFPKINLIENNPLFDNIANMSENLKDLSFYWKDSIEMEYVNNNYLGPNPAAVIEYYNDLATFN